MSSSSRWFSKYFKDWYFQKAQQQKLRSRSWFKLQSIDRTDVLFCNGMTVIDLGSTPGGWSAYAMNRVGNTGSVIACDILPMKKIIGVNFLQRDCSDPSFLEKLLYWLQNKKAQIVLSDMSPNMTGISVIDVNRSIYLGRVALNICINVLISNGTFLVKIFQGEDFSEYLYDVRSVFKIVKIRKPKASRNNSREVYIVAKGLKKYK